jgi:VWFA-related protein
MTRKTLRPSLLTAAWLGSTLWLPATAGAAEVPRFGDVTRVVTVEVPVQVLVGGEPVRGLSAADFVILDDGRERPLAGFEVVDLLAPAQEPGATPAPLPAAARRHLLLLFDLSFSDPASIERARRAGHEVVRRALVPSDRVAVAAYSASGGVELILGFTPDHAQVAVALDGLGLARPIAHHRDPLQLVVADLFDPTHPYIHGGGGGNNKAERYDAMRANYRDLNSAAERSIRERQETEILRFMTSLEEVGDLLRDLPGRKQVVLLSEGFDDALLVGTADPSRLEQMAADAGRGEYWHVDSEERFGSSTARRTLEVTVEALRRAGCSVQAVDIGGLRAGTLSGPTRTGHNGLFALADATGGELFRNDNDLADAMARLLEHQRLTYVLSFTANDLPEDGAFHRLDVRVPAAPRAARVLHQPGYYAPRPFLDLDPARQRLDTAGLLVDGRDGGAWEISALAAPFALDGERFYVPILLEIDGPSLLAGGAASIAFDVYGYAIAEDGTIRGHLSHAAGLDLAVLRERLAAGGLRLWEEMVLPAGEYRLRFLLRDSGTGEATVVTAPLSVPAGAGRAPALLPPFVPDGGDSWVVTRPQASAAPQVPYPFLLGGEPFVPAARPVLTAGANTRVSLMGYHLAPDKGVVTAALVGGAGTFPVTVHAVQRGAEDAAGGVRFGATLEVPAVVPGRYELSVSIGGPDGVTASLPVRVASAAQDRS